MASALPMQRVSCVTTVNARAFAFLGPPANLVDPNFSQCANLPPLRSTSHSCRARLQATRRRTAVRCAKEQRGAREQRGCVASHRAWAKKASALTCTTLRRRHPSCCEGKRWAVTPRLRLASGPTKPLVVGPQAYLSRRVRESVTTTLYPFSTFHWALQVMSKEKGDEYDFTTPQSWAMLAAPTGTPDAQPVPTSTTSPTSVRVHCDDGQVVREWHPHVDLPGNLVTAANP